MKNKTLFSLSLFLVLPAATQCMKRLPSSEIQTIDFTQTKKQKTQQLSIEKLQHRRNKLLNALKKYDLKSDNLYLTKHCAQDILTLIQGFHLRNHPPAKACCMVGMQAWIKICPYVLTQISITDEQRIHLFNELPTKYSLAGLLTMSVKNCIPCDMTYKEKKERLSQFLDSLPDASTLKDKELALVEKWERCENVIKNISVFRLCFLHSKNLSIMLPEIVNSITSLMFETEESLL